MSFLQNLRMANIFPSQGGTPFGMPNMKSGDNPSALINQVMPIIQAEKDAQRRHEMELAQMQQPRVQQLGASMMQPQKKNVVYQPEMTPFQQQSLALRAQDIGQRGQANEGRLQSAAADRDIRQQRADTYRMKAEGYNFDFRGPSVLAIHPTTGQVTDTGISTGSMDEYEKIMLGQTNALSRIQATGQQQQALEGTRQTGREKIAKARGWGLYQDPQGNMVRVNVSDEGQIQPITTPEGTQVAGLTRPGTPTSTREELPTQIRVRQFNAAEQLRNTNPELRPFIKVNPRTKSVEIAKQYPDAWTASGRGPTNEQLAQINETIYGKGQIPISQPGRTGAPTQQAANEDLTRKAPPSGAKPGGKWIKSKYGPVYQEP